MISEYKDRLDNMVWSYSRVNSYAQCPFGWKLRYIDHVSQEGSAFAEWGSLCHSIFEDYAKGELMEYELGDAYEERYYEYMKNEFPPSRGQPLDQKYYERGHELFSMFPGFSDNWEILGVELEVNLEVGGRKFTGFIDLLVRERDTNQLMVIDHKSKSKFKNTQELADYAHQLYLYAEWVYQTYGEYPATLMFNMFRVGEEIKLEFDKDDLDKAKQWFTDVIDAIYEDVDFWDKIVLAYEKKNIPLSKYKNDDFFCRWLCGSRKHCLRSGLMED